jgi:four helix bundle protein
MSQYIYDTNIKAEVEDSFEEYNSQKDFPTLDAWKKAKEVKLFFYNEILPCLPSDEKFNLNIQIRKAGVSATANIAEGYGRYHYKEGIQFYRIARASVFELKDHLMSCYDFGFIDIKTYEKGLCLIEDVKMKINGYIKYVQNKITI